MNLSLHAAHRCKQRSVSAEQLEFVLTWGELIYQPEGRVCFYMSERQISKILSRERVEAPRGVRGVAAVQALDGTILTVIRTDSHRRLRLWSGCEKGTVPAPAKLEPPHQQDVGPLHWLAGAAEPSWYLQRRPQPRRRSRRYATAALREAHRMLSSPMAPSRRLSHEY